MTETPQPIDLRKHLAYLCNEVWRDEDLLDPLVVPPMVAIGRAAAIVKTYDAATTPHFAKIDSLAKTLWQEQQQKSAKSAE